MRDFGRAGLIVHPAAGRGEEAIRGLLPALFRALKAETIFLTAESIEAKTAAGTGVRFTPLAVPPARGLAGITEAVGAMIAREAETIIGVGGDGTLGAIANSIVAHGGGIRLLGIGAGSSNVGPLVTILGEDLDRLDPGRLTAQAVHGIAVAVNGNYKGNAFNDVTFSNVFFGTEDDRRVDLDARAILDGVRREAEPRPVCGKETRVYKNGRLMIDAGETAIEQIVASPIDDPRPYAGKAVSGLLCWGPYLGKDGVLTAASTVLIRTHIDGATLAAVEPLLLRQVGFGEGEIVAVTGVEDGGVVIVDGNPICPVGPDDRIELRLNRDVLQVYKLM